MAASACGTSTTMSCSSRNTHLFPQAAITSVKESMKKMTDDIPTEIPEKFKLQPSLDQSKIRDAVMVELKFDAADMSVHEVDVLRSAEVIDRYSGNVGSICLVIRRPGCIFCREQALTLSTLAALYKKEYFAGFKIFGVVKETGVDDSGLSEFRENYFRYPLVRDESYTFYQALGDRKAIGLGGLLLSLLNPMQVAAFVTNVWTRITTKKIAGNVKGEGLIQGGIIVFAGKKSSRPGRAVAMYQEETGQDLPVVDFLKTLQYLRHEHESEVSSS